ncbi:39S ribosomal protein L39, mitochondrial [Anoplophora glabripennis]|uniref:39S ribosomal protein L39, mitochondrial n=1 Tax=Anoplophora glabripennis TaxID=217634 RepID=UPI0008744F4F|nr:39S ribosomal protein L39, mitochondrial [Anoplophora glabripennis]
MTTLGNMSRHIGPFIKKTEFSFKRLVSSISEESKRQNDLFITEQKRQKELVGRIEKIEISYEGAPENVTLVMNKNLSTPYDCAKHLGDNVRNKVVVALLNHETLWHMHKPLPGPCKLELLHYHLPNPASVNKTFWRSCNFILGAVISNAFKDDVSLYLHSFPSPNVKSGSFVYDVQLTLDNWIPTTSELKVLSIEMIKFCQQEHPIHCLDVDKDLALDIFRSNPHKTKQIPDIAAHNSDKVTLFKAGTHVDISRGPMIPNTSHMGRVSIANVIKLDTDIPGGPIYRFQGVALPKVITLNHFAYSLLEDRARTLNSGRIPGTQGIDNEDNSFIARVTS